MPTSTIASQTATTIPPAIRRPAGSRWSWYFLIDIAVFLFVMAAIYGLYAIGHTWLGPVPAQAEISQSPRALPLYAFYSLVRIAIAYALSLAFALAYGYVAARSKKAEIVLIPLLDILQSIPVLSFLPGVMLAMVALFPHSQLGIELGSIILIFTGQVWNIAFSFYSSLKGIPRELREAAIIYRFGRWQRFVELDLPYSTIGLVWNSMMSVAGGWFFLMACEMFVLGDRDFRLPGLGSFLQTAASHGNTRAILWGLAAMVAVIVLLDQLIWRPVISWADKFKFEQVETAKVTTHNLLTILGRASFVIRLYRLAVRPILDRITVKLAVGARRAAESFAAPKRHGTRRALLIVLAGVILVGLGFAVYHGARELSDLRRADYFMLLRSSGFTLLRVSGALFLGALWTVPAGVAIGFSPRLSRIAQPLAQIAASIPATALFPVILLFMLRFRGGLELAAMVVMLLGTQWYILFNVIAGAMAIPTDLKEAAGIFRFGTWERWRRLILPGIFPYLVTGLVTASGNAWNASIIAEYFHFQGRIVSITGLGSAISSATDAGRFDLLLASTLIMATIVVLINRLVWRRLYRLASTRFKLET
ncbi:MAG: ABC transporter permease subunit [Candidatus Acidiferrum sp.]